MAQPGWPSGLFSHCYRERLVYHLGVCYDTTCSSRDTATVEEDNGIWMFHAASRSKLLNVLVINQYGTTLGRIENVFTANIEYVSAV